MMGRLDHDQEQLFYSFRLDEAVPDAAYVILDRQFGLFGSRFTSPVEAVAPASQKDDAAPSPTIRSQPGGCPCPSH
jgi:hypothetical protein